MSKAPSLGQDHKYKAKQGCFWEVIKRERFCLQLLGEDGNLYCQMLRLDGRLFLWDGGVASPATHTRLSTNSWRYFRHFHDGWGFLTFICNKCHFTEITNSWVKPSKLIWYVTFCFVSGQEAVVVKNGSRLCGTGAARASTPILQNKAYWEIKLQQSGIWSCGLGNPSCDLTKNLGEDQNSWALTHENVLKVNGNIEHKIESKIQEGDIIVSGGETRLKSKSFRL